MYVLMLKMVLSCGTLFITNEAPAAPWKRTPSVWRAERGSDEGAAPEKGSRRRERAKEMIVVFIMDK